MMLLSATPLSRWGIRAWQSQSQQFNTYDEDDITLTKGIISKRTKPAWSSYDAVSRWMYISITAIPAARW